jgi:SAM-dependent methyltransferase
MDLDPPAKKCPLCDGPTTAWAAKSRASQTFNYDRCLGCGFAFVNPRPTMQALALHYSSPIPHHSGADSSPAPLLPADQRELGKWPSKAIRQILDLRPGPGHFLDIGAADGAFSLAAIRAGLLVTALEIDPDDLPALKSIPQVRVIEQLFEDFDAAPASCDYILMSHVLEHVHDPRAWIEKAANLLTPGGVLAIMLPHFDSIYRLLGGVRDPYFIPPDHLNHFNRRSLSSLSQKFGLRVVKVDTTSEFKNDVITKRISFPTPIAPAVRGLTACVSATLDWTTWALGIGSVLVFYARKP